jgi:rhodanese-related sulfurtransferase
MDLTNYIKKIIVAALVLVTVAMQAQPVDYCNDPKFEDKVSSVLSFSVPVVSVTDLDNMDDDVYILDAREPEEYDVSHIPGAQYIGYDKPDWSVLDDIPSDGKIVLYCSVGYRSEKLGEKVQEKGFSNVYNLYGSIFEWANEGLPLVDKNGENTKAVHTWNKRWSQWVTHPSVEKVR